MPLLIDDPTCTELLEKTDRLSAFERAVLQLLAVADEPLTGPKILELCKESGLLLAFEKQTLSVASLSVLLRGLKQEGLLGSGYQVNEYIVEVMVRQVFADTTTTLEPPAPAKKKKRVDSRSRTRARRTPKESLSLPLGQALAQAVRTLLPVPGSFSAIAKNQITAACSRKVRELRLALVDSKDAQIDTLAQDLLDHCLPIPEPDGPYLDPVVRMVNTPFDPTWITSLSPHSQGIIFQRLFAYAYYNQENDSQALQLALKLTPHDQLKGSVREELLFHLLIRLLLTGQLDQVESILAANQQEPVADWNMGIRGWLSLLQGQVAKAIELYEADLKTYRRLYKKRNQFFCNITGPYFIYALLIEGSPASLNSAASLLNLVEQQLPPYKFPPVYAALRAMLANLTGTPPETACRPLPPLSSRLMYANGPAGPLFVAMALFCIKGKLTRKQISALEQCLQRCQDCGDHWLTLEYAQLLSRADKQTPKRQQLLTSLAQTTGIVPLSGALQVEEDWQKNLRALHMVVENAVAHNSQANGLAETRLVYLVEFSRSGELKTISPLEQKRTVKGTWSKGRAISLKRLATGENLNSLSEHDQRIRVAIRRYNSYYSAYGYSFNMDELLPALVGHPLLFLAQSPTTPVEIVAGVPEVQIDNQGDKLSIRLHPKNPFEEPHVLVCETPTRYRLITFNKAQLQIAQIIGSQAMILPSSADKQLNTILSSVANLVPVHSTVPGTAYSVENVDTDSLPRAHLLPHEMGLRLEILIHPLGEKGPCLKPGKGVKNLMADVAGKRYQCTRALKEEQQRTAALLRLLPSLENLLEIEEQWFAPEAHEALQLLQDLQEAQAKGETQVVWPEGEKFKLGKTLTLGDMQMRLNSRQSWFEIDGSLQVDADHVLDMRQLLALLAETPHRFLHLGDGEFAAISRELRKRLDDLAALSQRKGKKLQLHPLAALALEDLTEDIGHLEVDKQWQQRLRTIGEGMALTPQPPSTLKAQLRDYQLEGFQWLARLAHLEFGACLADDMGLGKTLQALAVILHSAQQGPTLVIAPTSVCGNWIIEAQKFAPTLRPISFGGSDRAGQLAELGPFDLMIASYGLLHQEADLLCQVAWQTVVLDEAQAIKNASTKRSKAAMRLQAKFRLITTGTPIENHLSEFWTLFHFINPGLLGSKERFNNRFAIPIEREHDREAGRRLKKLVRPFVLRRLKTQVLEELPPRTEVTLEVEQSPEEAAFYEALRQKALERIEAEQTENGNAPIRILAEITRLRQACCHPKLVTPESKLSGGKLQILGSVLSELLENGHKALVFSQFVGHLNLIREHLETLSISYCYLDGATPAKKRQQEVERFQAGKTDVFLISLKAGGLGLNLTAADYVIHMDPWWNPAVEDQASDRAHRMGQQRPVTVYRLITKHTIEEKIVRLHAEKRDLADSLLKETDTGTTLSADELLRLIRDA
ncbi:DEAD/DEAH box helicase [Desulfobulbus rhabdoformis]|uniref:DEAD/DEAH box helicase n=1 Tax=Desulfobulbus rhabdoformis TaxID=34032 RepID=UPI0019642ABF|nr:DEAD/DEAH box helicase [Desulfobulbus rhabdoformis]MBM9615652.1 DEAD/DEAH box helicase [Desulfobulbus rhabdoformis]